MQAKEIMSKLTLKEKCQLLAGKNFWHTKDIKRLNLPSVMVADGPHGLRKQIGSKADMGLSESVKATCFPTAVTLASSFDPDLIKLVGEGIAKECRSEGVSMLLGPGINMKRSPLSGRNFEYFSEDPLVSGTLAAAFIQGVEGKGIATSLKHYAVNNQESYRLTIDALVDERALRDIYLKGFEIAVKQGKPSSVMGSYNLVNGEYAGESRKLLDQILRKEWNFEGLILSDWGAVNDRIKGLEAGLDLEMPGPAPDHAQYLEAAVKKNIIKEEVIDQSVMRILTFVQKALSVKQEPCDLTENHRLARKVAQQSLVLLKNDAGVLPLNPKQKIGIIGGFAKFPRIQGAGSSLVNAHKIITPLDGFIEKGAQKVHYAQGYDHVFHEPQPALIEEAVLLAKTMDVVVVFAGLPDSYESEAFDREHLHLPDSHNALIDALTKENVNVVVVLMNGAPVLMPWLNEVDAVLEAYLPGEAGGHAIWDVLFGDVNPSGKLAETFPLRPYPECFPMGPKQVEYRESIYVGYRYYLSANEDVLFPFGHGLSYTTFDYANVFLDKPSFAQNDTLTIRFTLKNSGKVDGAEVVQLYVKNHTDQAYHPDKELKGFQKVFLKSGEEKEVEFMLSQEDLSYYELKLKKAYACPGMYTVYVGSSSTDLRLSQKFAFAAQDALIKPIPSKYFDITASTQFTKQDFEGIYGKKLFHMPLPQKGTFTRNATIEDVQIRFIGRLLYKNMKKQIAKMDISDERNRKMIEAMMLEMPLRGLVMASNGKLRFKALDALIDALNGKYFTAIKTLIFGKSNH